MLKIAIRGNGTGLEYMCPTRHFVYIFFNPVFQLSTAKNEINLLNNHILIVAPVTFALADAMTPSAEFLSFPTLYNRMLNPPTPEFLKWAHPSLNLDTSIVSNRYSVINQ